jgi:hypothetical protein
MFVRALMDESVAVKSCRKGGVNGGPVPSWAAALGVDTWACGMVDAALGSSGLERP